MKRTGVAGILRMGSTFYGSPTRASRGPVAYVSFYRLADSSGLGVGYTGILYLYSQLLSTRSTSLS